MPPPQGFNEVLKIRLPAKIAVDNRVTIWPQPSKDLSSIFGCKFDISEQCLSALGFLAKGPFYFPADPHLDPLERLVTPGAGERFQNELIESAKISDPEQKHKCRRVLESYILPAHEANGHVEINLSAEKSSFELMAIWQQLQECLTCPDLNKFLGFPDHTSEDMLFEYYMLGPVHELYALLKEESAWKRVTELPTFEPSTSNLKQAIRIRQDNLAVKLLQILIEKSGNDIARVQSVIDELVLKQNMSLSHFMPHLFRDLHRGVEIDKMVDFVLEQTSKKLSKQYSSDGLEREMKDQRQFIQGIKSSPEWKAVYSTYMSLGYDDSHLDISFCSQETGEYAVRAIPNILIVREAKRILDREGRPYRISPLASMEPIMTGMLEEIAYGRFKDDKTAPAYQFDALKDFRSFYLTWRPALLLAQNRLLGDSPVTGSKRQ